MIEAFIRMKDWGAHKNYIEENQIPQNQIIRRPMFYGVILHLDVSTVEEARALVDVIPGALRASLALENTSDDYLMVMCKAGREYEEQCLNALSRNTPLGAYPAEIISARTHVPD